MTQSNYTTEIEALDELLEALSSIQARLCPQYDPNDEDLFSAATSIVGAGMQLARGLILLLKADLSFAACPAVRSLDEAYCELVLLLDQGCSGARKMLINSLLEMMELGEKHENEDRERDKRDLYAVLLKHMELTHSNEAVAVLAQRKRRRFHWSGLTRSEVHSRSLSSGQMYTLFSAESHLSLIAMRDCLAHALQFVEHGSPQMRQFPAVRATYADPSMLALVSVAILHSMWCKYAEYFSLPSISFPQKLIEH